MLKLIKNFTKKEWILALICLVLVVTQVWLELKMPDYMSEITKLVQTEGSQMKDILVNGGYMLTCALGSLVAAVITGYITSRISSNFSKTIRKKLFNKVEDLAMQEVKQFSTSSLITRTTNDITQIEMLIAMGLQLLIKAPITAIWAITKILNKSWQWSAITAVAVAILMTTIAIIMVIVLPRFKKVQKLIDKLNGVTRENLTGIRVVRAFNAEQYQEEKFDKANNNLTNQQLFNQKVFAVMQPMMYIIMYMVILSIYYVGAYLIKDAGMADKISLFGDMVVFSSYAMQVIMSFLMLAMIFMMLPRAQVSANRINEVLDTEISIKDGKINTKTNNEVGTVEFKNVSFRYNEHSENVLENISFTAKQGETIGIIGSTGCGKSSFVNLIPRLYDVSCGEILIGKTNIKDISLSQLRENIGIVLQENILFSGTIESNIRFGNENASKDMIIDSAVNAQAYEFINNKEDKFDSEVEQRAKNLSGGQKQRLSIARTLIRNPKIFIMDDSSSALDMATEAKLQNSIKETMKDSTVIVIAQRISGVMDADKIIVMDDGKIANIGTHKELLKTSEIYRSIAVSQLGEEVLESVG